MFNPLKPEELFAQLDDERKRSGDRDMMPSHANHMLNFIFKSGKPIDESMLSALCEKVYWKTCLRLELRHARLILALFPHTKVLLVSQNAGPCHEDTIDIFIEAMSVFLTGATFENSSRFRDLLVDQHRLIFKALDEQHERRRMH